MERGGTLKRLLLVAVVLAAGVSCSRPMIAAFGSNSEVVIITSPRSSEEGEMLKSILEREIVTVQYEKAFEVRLLTSMDIDNEKTRKNIILLDYLAPEGGHSKTILKMAGGDKQAFVDGRRNFRKIDDRWARGQVVMLIAAPQKADLDSLLTRQEDEVFAYVSGQVQGRLNRALFYAGEQEAATRRLAETYGWSLRLPTGYDIDEKYASQRVIKILKDKPARMITVYWEGGEWEDRAASCLERKKMLAWEYWDEDEVVDETLEIEAGQFLGHESAVLGGTWENKKYTIGGVFVAYCFRCAECGQNYVVDGSVFAPGLEKLPLMREVKAILSTFRCCQRDQS
jgi:hypothetical protein